MTREEISTQSPQNIELMRQRSRLIGSGTAVIVFSVWSVVKALMQTYYQVKVYLEAEEYYPVFALVIAVFIISGIDMAFKLYVGLSARSVGMGKKKKKLYIVFAVIILIMSALSLVLMIIMLPEGDHGILSEIVSLAVEATAFFAVLQLVIAAFRIRALEKNEQVKAKG